MISIRNGIESSTFVVRNVIVMGFSHFRSFLFYVSTFMNVCFFSAFSLHAHSSMSSLVVLSIVLLLLKLIRARRPQIEPRHNKSRLRYRWVNYCKRNKSSYSFMNAIIPWNCSCRTLTYSISATLLPKIPQSIIYMYCWYLLCTVVLIIDF